MVNVVHDYYLLRGTINHHYISILSHLWRICFVWILLKLLWILEIFMMSWTDYLRIDVLFIRILLDMLRVTLQLIRVCLILLKMRLHVWIDVCRYFFWAVLLNDDLILRDRLLNRYLDIEYLL